MIPITLLPKEKKQVFVVYRSEECIEFKGIVNVKSITGKILNKDYRLPYHVNVHKNPLKFSAKRIDFSVLQINEKTQANISIANASERDIKFEIFLPYFEVCGIKVTPAVATIKALSTIQVSFEYKANLRKIGAFTLENLRKSYEEDPKKNFELKIKIKKGLIK